MQQESKVVLFFIDRLMDLTLELELVLSKHNPNIPLVKEYVKKIIQAESEIHSEKYRNGTESEAGKKASGEIRELLSRRMCWVLENPDKNTLELLEAIDELKLDVDKELIFHSLLGMVEKYPSTSLFIALGKTRDLRIFPVLRPIVVHFKKYWEDAARAIAKLSSSDARDLLLQTYNKLPGPRTIEYNNWYDGGTITIEYNEKENFREKVMYDN